MYSYTLYHDVDTIALRVCVYNTYFAYSPSVGVLYGMDSSGALYSDNLVLFNLCFLCGVYIYIYIFFFIFFFFFFWGGGGGGGGGVVLVLKTTIIK